MIEPSQLAQVSWAAKWLRKQAKSLTLSIPLPSQSAQHRAPGVHGFGCEFPGQFGTVKHTTEEQHSSPSWWMLNRRQSCEPAVAPVIAVCSGPGVWPGPSGGGGEEVGWAFAGPP